MESVGEEKKIQALFSEVRFADEQTTPSFAPVWNRARAKTPRPRRAFNLSFVAATALLVCALVSLAWWSTRWQRNREVIAIAQPAPVVSQTNVPVYKAKAAGTPGRTFKPGSPATRLNTLREAGQLAANRKAAQDAKAIASWKSPTATLLDSPSDGLLKSLPQMNQTVDEMKSFLPSQPE